MARWTFLNWKTTRNASEKDLPFSYRDRFEDVLYHASLAQPTPGQTGFYVRSAALTKEGSIISGGNHEYGHGSGIHGEECVIARSLEQFPSEQIVAVGFVGENQGKQVPHSCGNCRDVMSEYMHPKGYVLNGDLGGGDAIFVPFREYLFENYRMVQGPCEDAGDDAMIEAFSACEKAYAPYVENGEHLYGVALRTAGVGREQIFRGSYFGDVAFHSMSPILACIANNRDSSNDASRLEWKELVVASIVLTPRVLYKERQHLHEMVSALRAEGVIKDAPLPIRLVSTTKKGAIMCAWETDSDEWLPHPFTAKDLGLEHKLREHVRRLLK